MSYNRRTVLWFSENHALVLREPCSGSGSDLREGLFNEEVTDGIEVIRSVVDMKGLAERVKAHGAVNVGHMDGQSFAENMKKLTNSVDNIPNEKLEDAFTKFLKSFEQYIEDKGIDEINLISRYEVHFGPGRQLDQENAHMEMYTAENGPILVQVLSYPILVQADPLIKRALDKYFKDHNQRGGGKWRMYHADKTRFYQPDDSKVTRRLLKEKSKLTFVDV